MKINKKLIISIIIPLVVGGISALLSMNGMQNSTYIKPPLTPPNWLFPVAWTIFYILMGISSYLISESDDSSSLKLYGFQLFLNGMWSIIFFTFQSYFFALIWIIILDIAVVMMIIRFTKVNKTAGLLQVPYFLWLLFATYLNLMVYILN